MSGVSAAPRPRILLVEDDDNDEALLRLHLERVGLQAHMVRVVDVAQMKHALDAEPWDVVVADYTMPAFGAERALELLRERGLDLPLIVLSGTIPLARAMDLLHRGARDFVEKDHLDRLEPAIAREIQAAENRRLRREAERQREQLVGQLRAALQESDRLNASLQQASRAKDEFLATVSHELRTPLNAIYGWARMLTTGAVDGQKAADAAQVIERNARNMTTLVEDLLDVARMARGEVNLQLEPVDLARVLDEVLDSLRVAVESKGLHVEQRTDAYARRVIGDPTRLRQIVWNLLSNAVKFTPAGGRIQAALERRERSVVLRVADTGEGIAPDFLPQVFEAFRQGDSGPTRPHGGLGLGMAITRHLVERHGGRIEAFSEGRGRGAVFVVELPVAAVWAGGPSVKAVTSPSLSGVRVLVVDDEKDSRDLLGEVLAAAGAAVTTADGVEAAMSAIDEKVPDVVVTDLAMPGLDGFELLRRIRARPLPSLPVLAVTAFAGSDDRRRTERAGFAHHLPKPVEPGELVSAVAAASAGASRPGVTPS